MILNKKKTSRKPKADAGSSPDVSVRAWGFFLLLCGAVFLTALVTYAYSGDGKNWLGPYFGVMLPRAVNSVFGMFPGALMTVAVILWGVWLLRHCPVGRLLRSAIGFSVLVLLFSGLFALRDAGTARPAVDALMRDGGFLGSFLVQNIAVPVFGGSVIAPVVICIVLILLVFVIAFGLRPSHFAFLKVMLDSASAWWKNRHAPEVIPAPVAVTEEKNGKAKKNKNTLPDSIDWNDTHTIIGDGKISPFKGPVGSFGGDAFPAAASAEDSADDTEIAGNKYRSADEEIAAKEEYLQRNAGKLGAAEEHELREEIAELRRLREANEWDANRRSKPSIQGIVRRHGTDAALAEKQDAADKKNSGEKSAGENKKDIAYKVDNADRLPMDAPRTVYAPYKLPEAGKILAVPPVQAPDYTEAELEEIGHQLEIQLENFKVKGKVVGISTGPIITRFEVEPGPGVKVSRFSALHEDLALALKAASIRVLAPIPGKSVVGIEVPNRKPHTIFCRDIFESPKFAPTPEKLIVALGKDITGNPFTMDLARAPHVLIAGQTGSGKSVCINVLMASLLLSKTPDDLRLILVDPKVVELKMYENIPHLLYPVITKPDVAVQALKWACREMDRRYDVLADMKVRNLAGYNRKVDEIIKAKEALKIAPPPVPVKNPAALPSANASPVKEDQSKTLVPSEEMAAPEEESPEMMEIPERLPYIVIIIDELADLMMVAGKEVEMSVARIAQKARAVGIHLVLATQRPSVNVITGLIKANLPTRISFKVASQIDARTVLDRAGSEKLLGRGDMLYRATEDPEPQRVHGAFLSDDEVERLADACSDQPGVDYQKYLDSRIQEDDLAAMNEDIGEGDEDGEGGEGGGPVKIDPRLFEIALDCAGAGSVSTSAVQRRYSVGFSRAGRIVDQMERLGICGRGRGSKPREMLMGEEEIRNLMLTYGK